MPSLVSQVVSWPVFVTSLLVFGFAPGAVLRLIVLLYPRDNPRRRELLGELYAVPRIERPFWVVEQLEVALSEGLGGRIARSLPSKHVGFRYLVLISLLPHVREQDLRRQPVNVAHVVDLISDRVRVPAEDLLADWRFVYALECATAGHFCRATAQGADLGSFKPIPLERLAECDYNCRRCPDCRGQAG